MHIFFSFTLLMQKVDLTTLDACGRVCVVEMRALRENSICDVCLFLIFCDAMNYASHIFSLFLFFFFYSVKQVIVSWVAGDWLGAMVSIETTIRDKK